MTLNAFVQFCAALFYCQLLMWSLWKCILQVFSDQSEQFVLRCIDGPVSSPTQRTYHVCIDYCLHSCCSSVNTIRWVSFMNTRTTTSLCWWTFTISTEHIIHDTAARRLSPQHAEKTNDVDLNLWPDRKERLFSTFYFLFSLLVGRASGTDWQPRSVSLPQVSCGYNSSLPQLSVEWRNNTLNCKVHLRVQKNVID